MLIDWHMHVWLPEHLGPIWGGELDRRYGRALSAEASFDDLDRAREEAGVEAGCVVALKSAMLQLDIPNEYVAEYVERRGGDTIGFASVDPNDPGAVDELRYAVETLGLRGLKLSPPYQGFHPHSPEAERVFRAAADIGLVLMFHQGAVFVSGGMLEVANPMLLDKVARDYPAMPLIVAHAGQPWFPETVSLMSKHENVFADISARFHRPWQLHNILLAARDYNVARKILFGTDFPALQPSFCLDQLHRLNELTEGKLPELPADLLEGIVHDRPFSLVGW